MLAISSIEERSRVTHIPVDRRAVRRRGPGRRSALLALTVLAAAALSATAGPAQAVQNGSLLLDDPFTGTSVANSGIKGLNDACLTAATAAPPAGAANLGVCGKRTSSPRTSVTPGFLQLTDASSTATGGVVSNSPLPADGGVVVTFDQYQYGGTGADGIGFFLSDGSADLTATGAPGGSLGYAQRDTSPGVVGGYLGVGLDAYGNFSNDYESRGAGCGPTSSWGPRAPSGTANTRTPNAVVLRGPGSGLTGYCYLAGLTLSTSLRGSGTPATEADIEALARTVQITVSEATLPLVTVAIDADGRGGPQGMVDVLSYQMTVPAPATYEFGFLGSTGGSTDVHLVRNLRVTSAVPLADLQLTKQVDRRTTQPASYASGATVPYQYLVTNSRDVPMTDVAVSDPTGAVTCPRTTLGVAGSGTARMVCTGAHVLSPADFDGHSAYGTTATAAATAADAAVASNPATATVPLAVRAAVSASVTATLPGGATVAAPGDLVGYSYLVRNSGNTPLSALALETARGTAASCPARTIAVGASVTCTAGYRVVQADVDAGAVPNAVTATATGAVAGGGNAVVTSPQATVSTPVPAAAPALTVVSATATPAGGGVRADTGEHVAWSFELRNAGNVTLGGVGLAVSGDVDGAATCAATVLLPLATTTCTAGHQVTSAEVLGGGPLVVTGTGTGTAPGPAAVTTSGVQVTMPLTGVARALGLAGVADLADTDADGRADLGEQVTYRWTVSNAGNVDLPSPEVTAPGAGSISCLPATVLAVGASRSCTGVRTVTQADLDAGPQVTNQAVAAAGTGATGVESPAVQLDVLLPAVVAGLHVAPVPVVEDTDSDGRADVGELVRVTYTVTNTGTQTVTGVAVTDPLVAADGVSCSGGALAPGAQRTCTSAHEVTQADVDAGRVRTVATASAITPGGSAVASLPTAAEVAAAEQVARVGLALRSAIGGGGAAARVRDVVHYAFTVGNEGNVTLHAVRLTVTGVVTSAACPREELAPGGSMECLAEYRVTQQDVDGQVRLTVQGVATGEPPVTSPALAGAAPALAASPVAAALPPSVTSAVVSAVDPVVLAQPQAVLTTATATFPDADGDGRAVAGEPVTYRFTVHNSGNTTLRDVAVAVTGFADPIACTPATLLPGESATCSAVRAITAEDVARGGSLVADARPLAAAPAGLLQVTGGRVGADLAGATGPVAVGPARSVPAEPAGLASTGLAPVGPLVAGVLLLAAGLALLVRARRRHTGGRTG
jgi:uncharacterized repeat protein (TIGR01451 family)